ncbi:MAG: polysaccharide biosynthesis tyrosine autokinase [Candidatus Omnitrophota bacterium]|jgi:capsular exopolysaccharide synthesis family protein
MIEYSKEKTPDSEEKELEIDLRQIYSRIVKHRRLILNFVYVFLGAAFLYSFIARPVYKSTARIMVEGKAPRITKVEDSVFTDYADRTNYFNSQIEILKSHAVANLSFDELEGYQPWGNLRGRGRDNGKLTKEERINRLLKTIRINPVRMTQIIEISAEDVDRQLAAKIVNSWVSAYKVFASLDELIQRRSELEADIDQNLKYVKEKHPIIQGLRSEIDAINAKIKGEESNPFNSNVKVLDAGQVPRQPVRPKLVLNLLFALFAGAFCGIAYVFILENVDQNIKTQPEVEDFLRLPCLSVLPLHTAKEGAEVYPCALVTVRETNSIIAEKFRGLRTGIIYGNPDLKKKVVLITSAGPSEGKSTVAVNLASAFAQFEGRTILIDADLRKPVLHSVFNLSSEKGLTELLAGGKLDFKPYLKDTGIKGLDFISCGTIPMNPAELLGSKKMEILLSELSRNYDRVIIDAPPVLAATDAVILSTKVDTTIMVFKAGVTHKQAALRAIKLIRSVHSNILGVVLNMVKEEYFKYDLYYHYYRHNDQKPAV